MRTRLDEIVERWMATAWPTGAQRLLAAQGAVHEAFRHGVERGSYETFLTCMEPKLFKGEDIQPAAAGSFASQQPAPAAEEKCPHYWTGRGTCLRPKGHDCLEGDGGHQFLDRRHGVGERRKGLGEYVLNNYVHINHVTELGISCTSFSNRRSGPADRRRKP